MLASISPLGERARHNRWAVTAGAYTVASVAAPAAVGAVAGLAGRLAGLTVTTRAILLAMAAALCLAADRRWPARGGLRRQVDEDWLNRYRGWVYGAGFGAQLGVGLATRAATAAVYLSVAGEILAGSALAGAAIGATFGLVRAAPVVAGRRVATFARLAARHRQLAAMAPTAERLNRAATALAGAGAAGVALGGLARWWA
ncbi:MAG: hypothetical protein ACRDY0_00715 [Acidimicrobiales bacterium]